MKESWWENEYKRSEEIRSWRERKKEWDESDEDRENGKKEKVDR